MSKVTVKAVNKAIAAAGKTAELVYDRHGYFYFINVGPRKAVSSGVYVYRVSELSIERWLRELEEKEREEEN